MKTPPLLDEIEVLLCKGIVASNLSIRKVSRDLGQGVTLFRG